MALLQSVSADGWLSFFGVIFGIVCSFLIARVSIKFEFQRSRNAEIRAAKPWLSAEKTELFNEADLISICGKGTIFVEINQGYSVSGLNIPQDIFDKEGRVKDDIIIIAYCLENVGGNTAVDLRIKLNGDSILPAFPMCTNREKTIIIVIPSNNDNGFFDYEFSFQYYDILYENKYCQKEKFSLKKDKRGLALVQNGEDFLTAPDIIKEKKIKKRLFKKRKKHN